MDSQELLRQYQSGRRDFSGIDFRDSKIEGRGERLENISLRDSNLNLAHLSDFNFINSDLRGILLNGAVLSTCNFINCNLSGASLNKSRIQSLLVRNSDFSKTRIENSSFAYISINASYMNRANFQKTLFSGIRLYHSDLSGIDLTDCRIQSNCEFIGNRFLYAILKSVKFHYNSRCNDFSFSDLRKANLSYMDLQNSNFVGADLREANLSYSNLQRVDMTLARLKKTNLEGANLKGSRGLRFVTAKPSGHFDIESTEVLEGAFLKNTRLPNGNFVKETKYYDAENPIGRTNSDQRLN